MQVETEHAALNAKLSDVVGKIEKLLAQLVKATPVDLSAGEAIIRAKKTLAVLYINRVVKVIDDEHIKKPGAAGNAARVKAYQVMAIQIGTAFQQLLREVQQGNLMPAKFQVRAEALTTTIFSLACSGLSQKMQHVWNLAAVTEINHDLDTRHTVEGMLSASKYVFDLNMTAVLLLLDDLKSELGVVSRYENPKENSLVRLIPSLPEDRVQPESSFVSRHWGKMLLFVGAVGPVSLNIGLGLKMAVLDVTSVAIFGLAILLGAGKAAQNYMRSVMIESAPGNTAAPIRIASLSLSAQHSQSMQPGAQPVELNDRCQALHVEQGNGIETGSGAGAGNGGGQ